MDKFEKIVFLEMTNKQFAKSPNSEYYETYKSLSIEDQDLLDKKISLEIHQIWSLINSKQRNDIDKFEIDTIEEYNENIAPVSDVILKVSSEFGITLRREISEELKQAISSILGKDYLNKFLDDIK